VVHSNGVTGENPNIVTASHDDSNLMPAIGITQEDISSNAAGEVILTGRILNIDTSNLVAGANVYVGLNGALTSTKPTGSSNFIQNIGIATKIDATEGELLVLGSGRSNDVPNILEGYTWVGNSDGVPTAIPTASFVESDFPYTGSAVISGSLDITGKVQGNVVTVTPASSTASFDLNDGTFFTSSLNGTTHITFSNVSPGVTAQIELTTAGTPVVDFGPNILQPSGSEYTPSDAGGVDLLTVTSLDGTRVYVVSANKFE
jgi:hypothetical protein